MAKGLGRVHAFRAGQKDGLDDLKHGEYSDPKASYFAFLAHHKRYDTYEPWMDHKDDYILGYKSTNPKK